MFTRSLIALTLLLMCTGAAGAQGTPAADSQPERIMLPGDGGEALLWDGDARAVLLAHGAIYDAESWSDQAVVLHAAGYTVLSLEDISAEAITTAIAWLLDEQGAAGVAVVGASAGGGGALRALSASSDGVVGLLLMGTTGDTAAIGDYPKLFTASEGEGMTDRLEAMADASAGSANRVEILPGSAHAQATFAAPEGELMLEIIVSFLDEEADWPVDAATPMAVTRRGRFGRG